MTSKSNFPLNDEYPHERNDLGKHLPASLNISDIKETQRDLVNNLFIGDQIDYSAYNDLFLSPKKSKPRSFAAAHTPNHDLERKLEDLEYLCNEKMDYPATIHIIDDIMDNYSKFLTRSEYIGIMFNKALAYHQLKDVISTYKQLLLLEPYVAYFDNDQKIGFYDLKGNVFLHVGEEINSMEYFQNALDAYTTLLNNANDVHPLLPDVYQKTKFKIAKIYMYIGKDHEAIKIFKEIILMPDNLFIDNEIANKTNILLKQQSRNFLRFLSEKEGE